MEVSARLARWVLRTFPPGSAEQVLESLRAIPVDQIGGQDAERVQAAMVVRTNGDWEKFVQRRDLVVLDWRDVLVGADLADEDWPDRLTAILGPR